MQVSSIESSSSAVTAMLVYFNNDVSNSVKLTAKASSSIMKKEHVTNRKNLANGVRLKTPQFYLSGKVNTSPRNVFKKKSYSDPQFNENASIFRFPEKKTTAAHGKGLLYSTKNSFCSSEDDTKSIGLDYLKDSFEIDLDESKNADVFYPKSTAIENNLQELHSDSISTLIPNTPIFSTERIVRRQPRQSLELSLRENNMNGFVDAEFPTIESDSDQNLKVNRAAEICSLIKAVFLLPSKGFKSLIDWSRSTPKNQTFVCLCLLVSGIAAAILGGPVGWVVGSATALAGLMLTLNALHRWKDETKNHPTADGVQYRSGPAKLNS